MDTTLIYFFYGLAFFSMGLVMLMEAHRIPLLAESKMLLPLSAFGFLHAGNEWLEMLLDKNEWFMLSNPASINGLRLGLLVLSFTFLFIFGLRTFAPRHRLLPGEIAFWLLVICSYLFLALGSQQILYPEHIDWLAHLDGLARWLLAIPAASLAGLALLHQAADSRRHNLSPLANSLSVAAFSFWLYAITQAFIKPTDSFPGTYMNTATFLKLAGFPIQVIRAGLAATITLSLLRAVQIADNERKRRFVNAQKERLNALEQAKHEVEARQALHQELLRRTVVAQEEERARIARELHDETGQILTAFSLHLAALRGITPETPQVQQQIDYLQQLSRQMSQGLSRQVHELRPAQLDDLGLVAALQYLADESRQRLELDVHLQIQGQVRRLRSLTETVIFRIAQEALTNIARHAAVKEATMQIIFNHQIVRLQIHDQGKGFDLPETLARQQSWGLAGMRERAASIGGQLQIHSTPGEGTVIEIDAPGEYI